MSTYERSLQVSQNGGPEMGLGRSWTSRMWQTNSLCKKVKMGSFSPGLLSETTFGFPGPQIVDSILLHHPFYTNIEKEGTI